MKKEISVKMEGVQYDLKTFDPEGLKFMFQMPGDYCEYKQSGVCPIKEGINRNSSVVMFYGIIE